MNGLNSIKKVCKLYIYIYIYKIEPIEVDKSKPIPQAEYRNNFMSKSQCIIYLIML